MRKYYIDNIRIICILLLFPFHTCMLFNTFGEPFYVFSTPVPVLSEFVTIVYPWWMTLLFSIAGMSSAYALNRRSGNEFMKERVSKLFIPLVSGILLIIPVQSYIADVFHNGYTGGYFEHYAIFFTKLTDMTGYDGAFTPGHLWFMLYLFISSMLALPVMLWYRKREKKIVGSKITMPILLPMFLILLFMTPVLDFGGKSIGEFLVCFLLGYFILSLEEVQNRLMKYRLILSLLWIILMAVRSFMSLYHTGYGIVWGVEQRMLTWAGILAILGLGKRYLNFNNHFTKYFSPAAFPLYYFHQSILVIIAFFTVKNITNVPAQFLIIMVSTFVLTAFIYEVFRRFSITCFLFGIKKKPIVKYTKSEEVR